MSYLLTFVRFARKDYNLYTKDDTMQKVAKWIERLSQSKIALGIIGSVVQYIVPFMVYCAYIIWWITVSLLWFSAEAWHCCCFCLSMSPTCLQVEVSCIKVTLLMVSVMRVHRKILYLSCCCAFYAFLCISVVCFAAFIWAQDSCLFNSLS